MPGPKKTPTPVLKLRGSWLAKDRKDVEVKSKAPQRPRGLDAGAKRHWDDIVPKIADMGILSESDWPKLRQMCIYYSELLKLEPHIQNKFIKTATKKETKADGTIIETGGNIIHNPAWTEYKKLWKEYDRIASQFCMGPSNRAGMGGIQDKEKNNDKAKFFRKNG